jgi:ATP:cob(I)alamin adenosyltransferase
MSSKVYTKKGDSGDTGLLGVDRVGKDSLRVEAYGTIDEATSCLGMARATTPYNDNVEVILGIQGELIEVMADCATAPGGEAKQRVTPAMVGRLESLIDRYTDEWIQTGKFAKPGGSQSSAALDMARTVVRRGERRLVALSREEKVDAEVIRYLNRLSDLLYVMARVEEQRVVKDAVEAALGAGGQSMQNGTNALPLAVCDAAVEAGIKRSFEIGVPMVLAVTDRDGNLIEVRRMDNALAVSLELAPRKAYTAAAVRMPTAELAKIAAVGGPLHGIEANLPRVTLIGGGLPIEKNGQVIGAVGVSGGSVEQDIDVAQAMLRAVT